MIRVLLTRDSRIDANARTVTALDARVYVCPVEQVRNEEYASYNPAGAVVEPCRKWKMRQLSFRLHCLAELATVRSTEDGGPRGRLEMASRFGRGAGHGARTAPSR